MKCTFLGRARAAEKQVRTAPRDKFFVVLLSQMKHKHRMQSRNLLWLMCAQKPG